MRHLAAAGLMLIKHLKDCGVDNGRAMWNTISSKQPRLSRNTVGCYIARSVLSNTDCAISKQLFLEQPVSLQNKSSQVSPNARRRAQCKGGGGKEKSIYVHTDDCTICRRLSENVVAAFTWNRNLGKSEAKHPIEPHFSQHSPSYPEL